MTEEQDEPPEWTGKSRYGRIKYSISNLWDDFGNVDNLALGILINIGLAAIGMVAFLFGEGLVAYAGVAWAIINIYPVLQWVFGL